MTDSGIAAPQFFSGNDGRKRKQLERNVFKLLIIAIIKL